MTSGYYRFPTVHQGSVVFTSEDDLFSVPLAGGVARRLTASAGRCSHPRLSPDGAWLAYVCRDEGRADVWVMPAAGGDARRLTYTGGDVEVVGWSPDSQAVTFCSAHESPLPGRAWLYRAPVDGGPASRLPYGPAYDLAEAGPNGAVVLGRNTRDPARWKRYRGGTAGHLWLDPTGTGTFFRQRQLTGNVARPMWVGERLYFLADSEGYGNLYSAALGAGGTALADVKRHTDHTDYYARNPSTDGTTIVYHAGGDLRAYDVASGESRLIEVEYATARAGRQRHFVDAGEYLQGYDPHPKGHSLAVVARGRAFSFGHWEGAVCRHGVLDGARHRLPRWLPCGKRFVAVTDAGGEEALAVYAADGSTPERRLDQLKLGRALQIEAAPHGERVALANHRLELFVVELGSGVARLIERNSHARISGIAWSPDGRWLAYAAPINARQTVIKIADLGSPKPAPPPATGAGSTSGANNIEGTRAADGAAGDAEASSIEPMIVTEPVLADDSPAWDPKGDYLYFLSSRVFDPVYDGLHFALGFPKGRRPYCLALRKDVPSPFVPKLRPLKGGDDKDKDKDKDDQGKDDEKDDTAQGDDKNPDADAAGSAAGSGDAGTGSPANAGTESDTESGEESGAESGEADKPGDEIGAVVTPAVEQRAKPGAAKKNKKPDGDAPKPVVIEFDGIEQRVVPFPLAEAKYVALAGLPGKVLVSQLPVEGALAGAESLGPDTRGKALLRCFDFEKQKAEFIAGGVTDFRVAFDHTTLAYRSGDELRVVLAGEKPNDHETPGRKSGWIDLERLRVSIDPASEWRQMYGEAWRLQRDHFWTPDMSQIDWQAVHDRYEPLLARIGTRSELSDLLWEMQGELGTSHAYEFGGDYPESPSYPQGHLGCELIFEPASGQWRIGSVLAGDPSDREACSPLARPGIDARPGDALLAINGQPLGAERSPFMALVNQAGVAVALVLKRGAAEPHTVTVTTLKSELPLRYRVWVAGNRARVHEASGGRVGYVHVPDMGPRGFAAFHRGFLAELDREALLIDVRHNGGGHVSGLLLEKLARRRLGYDQSRYGAPVPYPDESPRGPMVALTDELAGSDGDIFSHSFKMLGLGPLLGQRTWGGVIGVWPRHALVDNSLTTQPEFSFWFDDVGWGVENHGTEPDIEVEYPPQDWVAGRDPQLARAIEAALGEIERRPPHTPSFGTRPNLAPPALPPRG